MSNITTAFRRSRVVRRSKQRKGMQLQRAEGAMEAVMAGNACHSKSGHGAHIQRKISVGKANDAYEVEADNVADKVVSSGANNSIQSSGMDQAQAKPVLQKHEEEEAAQAKPLLLKQEEEEEAQTKPLLQKQEEEEETMQTKAESTNSSNASSGKLSDSVSQRLYARKGKGEPMSDNVQNFMQQHFQRDFSDVRVHKDPEAASISQQVHAQAFALGKDIYFNQGKFSPENCEGKRLLAHELTHVVQQNPKLKKSQQSKS